VAYAGFALINWFVLEQVEGQRRVIASAVLPKLSDSKPDGLKEWMFIPSYSETILFHILGAAVALCAIWVVPILGLRIGPRKGP
jgi:hypothetical protein